LPASPPSRKGRSTARLSALPNALKIHFRGGFASPSRHGSGFLGRSPAPYSKGCTAHRRLLHNPKRAQPVSYTISDRHSKKMTSQKQNPLEKKHSCAFIRTGIKSLDIAEHQ
jgi:hypothetical protein